MNKDKVSALLGRPLTPYEDTNFDLYIKIAKENLGTLLCVDLCADGPMVYSAREGYSTVFTDIFSEVLEVKLNGQVVTNYSPRQWNRRNADWYNSLVFDCKLNKGDVIEVDADWGLEFPLDLQEVIAGLFDLITKKHNDPTIQSKQVEDFRITFKDADIPQDFRNKYADTISKYRMCDIPYVKHGDINGCL
jgi:hypothetical protein